MVVTGPPRSGTSAVTRVLNLAGLPLCRNEDMVGGGRNNPTGHWESKTVLRWNNRLLDAAGMRWWCPDSVPTAAGATWHAEAAREFHESHQLDPWLCKDPRFALTLPFWRSALSGEIACIVVVRRPDEVVASLRRTWPLTVEHAAAVWARYLHRAVTEAARARFTVVRFPEVLADIDSWIAATAAVLAPLRAVLEPPPADELRAFVVQPRGATDVDTMPAFAWRTWEAATALVDRTGRGEPATWDEDPAVETVLQPLREQLRAGQPLDMRPVYAGADASLG